MKVIFLRLKTIWKIHLPALPDIVLPKDNK